MTRAGHRNRLYATWSDLLLDATAYPVGSIEEEVRLFFLSEVYRMGHNLDVGGSGELADLRIQECLRLRPRSRACNVSAARFLLSVSGFGAERLDRAQASLDILREEFRPALDEETEAGFVFLYVHRLDNVAAKAQIDYYLEHFPDTERAADFRKFRSALDRPIRRTDEW